MSISRSENMSRIKGKSTSIEIALRKELKKRGYHFKTNDVSVFGKPDIVFRTRRVAIFCDSEFWHGKNYLKDGEIPQTHSKFWEEKIQSNIKRDKKVTRYLRNHGWIVIRIWAKDIKRNITRCVSKIEKHLKATDGRNCKTAGQKTSNRFESRILRASQS